MKRRRLARRFAFVPIAVAIASAGCAGATVRQLGPREEHVRPAGVVQIRWRTQLHEHGLFEPTPEECATGVIANGRLVIGSRANAIVGVDMNQGHVDWATTASGGIDSEARFDPEHGQVYLGADDGSFYAVDPSGGAIRWMYAAKGAIERGAAFGGGGVYVATAADRVFSLDAATGKWRWQYERETPDGFTIHGYAGPRLQANTILSGFADGYLVSLSADAGEVIWARSLAAVSDQFVDVDSTPAIVGDVAYVSSYSGGLYALSPKDGGVRWRLGIEGAGEVKVADQRLYFAAPRAGVHAVDLSGHVLWRQALTAAGDLTVPVTVGPYLIFSGSRAGLFIVERDSGKLLEIFNPGSGICAAPTVDADKGRLYVLSNGGALYALDVVN
ncbi:MAG TPA: PQQ-binding-like beta-propeller repeat protein [Polyangia bacterium]|nr:PQQ-binding-like beta-propeller repeat protein [Polyangia bacterium]